MLLTKLKENLECFSACSWVKPLQISSHVYFSPRSCKARKRLKALNWWTSVSSHILVLRRCCCTVHACTQSTGHTNNASRWHASELYSNYLYERSSNTSLVEKTKKKRYTSSEALQGATPESYKQKNSGYISDSKEQEEWNKEYLRNMWVFKGWKNWKTLRPTISISFTCVSNRIPSLLIVKKSQKHLIYISKAVNPDCAHSNPPNMLGLTTK